ncbi:hypothetical protein [Porphyromonas cangingivalis]|uniref:hypothetical protein n=1 Tax=Porphyromonas cangingivalis TaxID=36874 RepID=UPI000687899B|nr:hypothetical protein [Porphyromonas cangingivalis]
MTAFKAKKRAHRLLPFEISHTQLKALKEMPFLSIPNRNKSGMVVEMTVRREKPFNTMASRTIGNLEKDVDSSSARMAAVGWRWLSTLCSVGLRA